MSEASPKKRPPRVTHKRATAYDVARLAGVSQSAVSRTFTAGASVSETTRQSVLAAARALNYRPNHAARTLSTSRSFVIGVAVSRLDNQYYPEVVERLSDAFAAKGYRILLFITKGAQDLEPMLDELMRFRIDALVLASSSLSSALADQCEAAGVPVLMFNNIDPDSRIAGIAGANTAGASLVADYLIEAGCRSFGFISGVSSAATSQQRGRGFHDRLLERGFAPPRVACSEYAFEGAWRATLELLQRKDRPDALFCANDHMALAALQAAQSELGLEVGREVSIVGFDNVAIAGWPSFSLTSYSQPNEIMISRAVERIFAMLEGDQVSPLQEEVEGELIVRGSARIPSRGVLQLPDGTRVWRPDR